jgi:hypothetical protein
MITFLPIEILMNTDDGKVKEKVFNRIRLLIKNDFYLLEIGANERSVAHIIAEYLQQEFPNWHFGYEYNRHGERIK